MNSNALSIMQVVIVVVLTILFHSVIDWNFLKDYTLFSIFGYYGAICLVIFYFFFFVLFARWFLFRKIEKPDNKIYLKRKEIETMLKNCLDGGFSILVEGPSGSGKSTLCKHMAHELSKNYPVLFYTATNTDFESVLLKSVTGFLAPVVIWWNKLSSNSDIKQWFNSILVASKSMKEKPIIFIDAINILENKDTIKQLDGKEGLLFTLFNIAQSTTKIRFVFITSDYGSHIIHSSSNYPLKCFACVFVGEVTHNEAVEYLNSLKISKDIHSKIFEICGYLMEFLSICERIVKYGNVDLTFLRYCVEIQISDRILRSELSTSCSQFIAFVKDLNGSKNHEVDLETLKFYFPEQSQIDNIIRGNALYISSLKKVSFQSKGIYNFVLNKMKL
ncbi:hypothetical protein ABK040_011653 [Willaertia magna]